ncbi:MAG: hypothetical protein JJT96_06860 [Opitutales bacterium]|nr:hypothetical protein [Opitutales bacterium]
MKKTSSSGSPLAFEVDGAIYADLVSLESRLGLKSLSAVVAHALSQYDFSKVQAASSDNRQMSVRVTDELRKELLKHSRANKVSVAYLIRAALNAFVTNPPDGGSLTPGQPAMAKKKSATKKAAAKKAVKKVAAKKAVKKVAAKKAVKKVAAKKAVKKVAVKKIAAKKAVKKVAAKKVAAKKAVVKKVVAKKAVKKAAAKTVAKKAVKKAAVKKAKK